jgi:hypothetical protein
LEGLEGCLLQRKRQTRLIVAVRMLQQGVSVEINDFLVEPVTAPVWVNMAGGFSAPTPLNA